MDSFFARLAVSILVTMRKPVHASIALWHQC